MRDAQARAYCLTPKVMNSALLKRIWLGKTRSQNWCFAILIESHTLWIVSHHKNKTPIGVEKKLHDDLKCALFVFCCSVQNNRPLFQTNYFSLCAIEISFQARSINSGCFIIFHHFRYIYFVLRQISTRRIWQNSQNSNSQYLLCEIKSEREREIGTQQW